jgi:long-chain acyl-CoA synthetase
MQLSRIFDLLYKAIAQFPRDDFQGEKVEGHWVTTSTAVFLARVQQLAKGFLRIGLQAGDRVAIISNNRQEWNCVDLALQHVGGISVPMYSNLSVEDMAYIFKDAGITLLFVNNEDIASKSLHALALAGMDSVSVYAFDKVEDMKPFSQLLRGIEPGIDEPLQSTHQAQLASLRA